MGSPRASPRDASSTYGGRRNPSAATAAATVAMRSGDASTCSNCEEATTERGTLRFDVLADPQNKRAFFVYEAYVNRRAFEKHQKGKAFKEWKTTVLPNVSER